LNDNADARLDAARREIARALPDMLRGALAAYVDAVGAGDADAAKDAAARHTAGKAAVAHIEALVRLARWAQESGDGAAGDAALDSLIAEAQRDLAGREGQ
jgi:hypothetical protein